MSNQNNGGETKGREEYKINITEHEPFNATEECKFIPSDKLCKLVSSMFRGAFADWEGCFFDIFQYNNRGPIIPSISLIFNHGRYDGRVTACELSTGKSTGNAVIDSVRNRDNRNKNGDRYYLTEDGKDVVSKLLIRNNATVKNGKIDWRYIVSEWTDPNQNSFYGAMPQKQFTKVSFIDIGALCGKIYGEKNEDGDPYEYYINVATAPAVQSPYQISPAQMKYVLNIKRTTNKAVAKAAEDAGLGISGSFIIR